MKQGKFGIKAPGTGVRGVVVEVAGGPPWEWEDPCDGPLCFGLGGWPSTASPRAQQARAWPTAPDFGSQICVLCRAGWMGV